jgi:hypothetical protein
MWAIGWRKSQDFLQSLEDILKNSNVGRWKNITATSNSLTVLAKLWATTFNKWVMISLSLKTSLSWKNLIFPLLTPFSMGKNLLKPLEPGKRIPGSPDELI